MRTALSRKQQLSEAIMKTTKMLARKGISVTQRGAMAYCRWNDKFEVVQINLPMMPDKPTDEFMNALQGYVDHECSHALNTDAKAYGTLPKASALNTSPGRLRELCSFLNIVEDVRIEQAMIDEFPGSEANINHTRRFIVDTIWRPMIKDVIAAGGPDLDLQVATTLLVPFIRGLGGQQICEEFCDEIGMNHVYVPMLAKIPDLADKLKAMKTTEDAFKIAELLFDACDRPPLPNEAGGFGEPEPGDEPSQSDDGEKGEDEGEGQDGEGGNDKSDSEDGDGDGEEGEGSGDGEGEGDPDEEGEGSGGGAGDEEGDAGDKSDKDSEGDGEGGGDDDGKTNVKLTDALKKLVPEQRRAIHLYSNKRQDIPQIAREMNRTEQQAADLLKLARRNLRKFMKVG